ncbi:VWA domain-containing protein, partial [Azospirillum sp. B4]|uniref:vWA domain-containing protein n=1 Tax=Azospirillum sp. B4 TaxID=95605 RepID=UPI0005CAEAFE
MIFIFWKYARLAMVGAVLMAGSTAATAAEKAPSATSEGKATKAAPKQRNAPALPPSTLRLRQVVSRGATLHLYATGEAENDVPVPPPAGAVFYTDVGGRRLPTSIDPDPSGTAIVFLIDVSRSVWSEQIQTINRTVDAWIDTLGPQDRAAVLKFGSTVKTLQDFTADKNRLRAALPQTATEDQTQLYQGLLQAIGKARRLDADLPLRRAIIVLTDGIDDQTGNASVDELRRELAADPVPIYAVGVSRPSQPKSEAALKVLGDVARQSGGIYRRVRVEDLRGTLVQAYLDLQNFMRADWPLIARCQDCPIDGSMSNILLDMQSDSVRLNSQSVAVHLVGADGRAISPPSPPPPQPPSPPPSPPPQAEKDSLVVWVFKECVKAFLKDPAKWIAIVVALLGGGGAVTIVLIKRAEAEAKKAEAGPVVQQSTRMASTLTVGVLVIKSDLADPNAKGRRLRIHPIGVNDWKPVDV